MTRTEPLGVRVSPEIKAKLLEIAQSEDRALASLVERILRDWLSAQSVTKKGKKI